MDKQNIEVTELDLENQDMYDMDKDRDRIIEELGQTNNFFTPVANKTYKIILTSPTVIPITKTFVKNGVEEEMKKFLLQIKAIDRDKNEFDGTWEIGSGTLRKIVKIFEPYKKSTEIYFKMTKSGAGIDTRYDIVGDDF